MNVLESVLILAATLSALWWAFARHRAPVALARSSPTTAPPSRTLRQNRAESLWFALIAKSRERIRAGAA
jgi:hypothetical protein